MSLTQFISVCLLMFLSRSKTNIKKTISVQLYSEVVFKKEIYYSVEQGFRKAYYTRWSAPLLRKQRLDTNYLKIFVPRSERRFLHGGCKYQATLSYGKFHSARILQLTNTQSWKSSFFSKWFHLAFYHHHDAELTGGNHRSTATIQFFILFRSHSLLWVLPILE